MDIFGKKESESANTADLRLFFIVLNLDRLHKTLAESLWTFPSCMQFLFLLQ